MIMRRRGLTLVEVVLAAALLAMLAAAVAPLIAELSRVPTTDAAGTDRFGELAAFADELLVDPSVVSLRADDLGPDGLYMTRSTPWGTEAEVQILATPTENQTFTWMVIADGALAVSRPVRLVASEDRNGDRP